MHCILVEGIQTRVGSLEWCLQPQQRVCPRICVLSPGLGQLINLIDNFYKLTVKLINLR